MIAFLIQGIQKNLPIPEQYYVFILDTDDTGVINHANTVFEALIKKSLLNIDITSYTPFTSDSAIDTMLEFTDDCEQFFTIPSEIAIHLIESVKSYNPQ